MCKRETRKGLLCAGLDRREPPEHRPRESRSRFRRASITTCGSARRPGSSPRTASLQLALVLGFGHRRARQQRHPRRSTWPATYLVSTRPVKVGCAGGKYYYDDDQQTPDTQLATFEFPTGPGGATGCTLVWEHRIWEKKGQGPEGQSYGIAIHGDKGTTAIRRRRLADSRRRRRFRKAEGQHGRGTPEEFHRRHSR